jgi:hypothetical protein
MERATLIGKYLKLQARQVGWYLKNGKYISERLRLDSDGCPYVVGDWAWQLHKRPDEVIEPLMDAALGLEPAKIARPRKKAERNKEIQGLRKVGGTLDAIGKQFGITRERVRQIVEVKKEKI